MHLDETDKRPLAELQAAGVITGYTARLPPAELGLAVHAFVQVQMATHQPDAI